MSTVALAHHWLVSMRGGERVLEEMCALFPRAPIHTLVARSGHLSARINSHPIIPSLLQHVPGAPRHYKKMLPLFRYAIPRMRVAPDTQFVFSSDASMIKGLTVPAGVPHVCYCHSPPRYLWDLHEIYMKGSAEMGCLGRMVFKWVLPSARRFDLAGANNVTHFIANSAFVRERIRRIYGRESVVIHPPVAVQDFSADRPREDFYLLVSELTPYKRVDLAVEAFRRNGRRLVVIGDGPEMPKLRGFASDKVSFLGRQPFAVLKEHLETCRAFVFPGIEDFGIAPCEAQAAGAPVIAFAQGGALETVKDGVTGIHFFEQTPDALVAAIERFEASPAFPSAVCRANVERFRPVQFRHAVRKHLSSEFPDFFAKLPWPGETNP